MTSHLAVDLGASSGRVSVVDVSEDQVRVHEVHRFAHAPLRWPDGWHWNVPVIVEEVLTGLRSGLVSDPGISSVGIDTWGVDYGLLDTRGGLLGLPFTHRDPRTRGRSTGLTDQELYRRTGVLTQEINTTLQLSAEPRPGRIDVASTLLFMPDLICYLLTGRAMTECSIASTSQLVGFDGRIDGAIMDALGIDDVLPDLSVAGSTVAEIDANVLDGRSTPLPVRQVAAHDTASAYAAVAGDDQTGFISCGTWGIAGVSCRAPVVTEDARLAGLTNEQTADGRFLLVRNLTGLWLISETLREWGQTPSTRTVAEAAAEAATRPGYRYLVDAADPRFTTPGGMTERLRRACEDRGQGEPADRGSILRCIFDSIGVALADAVRGAAAIAGHQLRRIHMVGGGSQIPLVAQVVADCSGVEVLAGPAEATTIGNGLLQAAEQPVADAAHVARILGQTRSYLPSAAPLPWAGQ